MLRFVFRATSYHPHKLDLVSRLLSCDSVRSVFGPFDLLVNGNKVRVNSISIFEDPKIVGGLTHGTMATVVLWCVNGIQVGFGTNSNKYMGAPNVFNFEFTEKHIGRGIVTVKKLQAIFADTIPLFMPDRIIVYDQPTDGKSASEHWVTLPDGRRYSLTLNWLDYFGRDLISRLGAERFEHLISSEMNYKIEDGIVVVLQQEPFDSSNPRHRQRRIRAEAELRLNKLTS